MNPDDQLVRSALTNIVAFREQLLDREVHPDRFAKWVAT
jgi:hypothetical protein